MGYSKDWSTGGVILTEADFQILYDEILNRYNRTKEEMINIIEDKECLLKHRFFDLKTDYIMKIGYLEHELFDLDIKLAVAKRKIELAQEALSQDASINLSMIESQIKMEFSDFLDVLGSKDNEIVIANYFDNMARLSDEELKELKKYYVAIARLILPDINPGLNDIQKTLWDKALLAYENGEIQFLIVIYKLAQDEAKATKVNKKISLNELEKQIRIFEERIKKEERDINTLLDNFPFNKADLLQDEEKIMEIQIELRKNIKDGKSILKLMDEHFLMMLDESRFES